MAGSKKSVRLIHVLLSFSSLGQYQTLLMYTKASHRQSNRIFYLLTMIKGRLHCRHHVLSDVKENALVISTCRSATCSESRHWFQIAHAQRIDLKTWHCKNSRENTNPGFISHILLGGDIPCALKSWYPGGKAD